MLMSWEKQNNDFFKTCKHFLNHSFFNMNIPLNSSPTTLKSSQLILHVLLEVTFIWVLVFIPLFVENCDLRNLQNLSYFLQ